jgi:hypothetical protein
MSIRKPECSISTSNALGSMRSAGRLSYLHVAKNEHLWRQSDRVQSRTQQVYHISEVLEVNCLLLPCMCQGGEEKLALLNLGLNTRWARVVSIMPRPHFISGK